MLELGLFIGALGRRRTFLVYDRKANIKLPSDLAGVTPATFQMHGDGNLQASVGAATTQIKGAMGQEGRRKAKITAEVDPHTQFQIIHDLLDLAPEQFLILIHETGKAIQRKSNVFDVGIRYVYEMKNRSSGQGSFSVDNLCQKLADAQLLSVDLRNNVSLTPRGKKLQNG